MLLVCWLKVRPRRVLQHLGRPFLTINVLMNTVCSREWLVNGFSPEYIVFMITAVQSKMARAALGWGVRDLAREANVGVSTVTRFEAGAEPIPATLSAIMRTLEAAGVEFIPENGGGLGVRLKRGTKE
jgi:hypothetical protein